MNDDQVKGRSKKLSGKIQKNLGRATGDYESADEGAAREAEGKVQKGFGDLKRKVGKAIDR